MPIARLTRLFALAAAPFLLLAACNDRPTGEVRVSVVGATPKLVDPAAGPVSSADAVLLQNSAQGLVAFDAKGDIVGGLAERWNVSDDGLSYIFRIASGKWTDGTKITAEQVARALRRQLASRSRNGLKDTLGAIAEVVAMTDRVIEIRLVAPRPNFLPLLAQPEMAVLRGGRGSGPFTIDPERGQDGALRLERTGEASDEEEGAREQVLLRGMAPEKAVSDFLAGDTDLVLGGTYADLPLARRVTRPRGALRFDPVSGLFGLVPARTGGRYDSDEWRALLSEAIDREALVAAFGVPGLRARATLLEPGLDGLPPPVPPAWAELPMLERTDGLAARARTLLGSAEDPVIKVAMPASVGGDLVLRELGLGWRALGLRVERVSSVAAADFVLIDEVAPSSSAAWFARRFRCASVKVCDGEVDELLAAARAAPVPAQRYALLAQAAAIIDRRSLFIPITAPIRWSLVGDRIATFAGNRYARHSLMGLERGPSARE